VTDRSGRPASLARNTVAQSAPRALGYLFSFLSAPVIVEGLGLRDFGIWALTGALAQYGALLDLGVGISVARYIAAQQDDRRLCGEYVGIGYLSVAAIAVVLTAIATATAGIITRALHGISLADMRVVLYSSVVLLCCSMLASVIAAYPIGRRRMVMPNVALMIGASVNFVASVGSIALGAGLPGYALANAGSGVVSVLILLAFVVKGEGSIPLSRPNARRARAFMAFAIKNQTVRLTSLVNYQSDKIVIAFSIGPAAAGAYELANRVAIAVREIGIYATSAVDVELTAIMRNFGLDRVRATYGRLTSVAVTFAFPPVLLAAAVAPLLLATWLSHAPPNATLVLVALSMAYLISVSTAVGYGIAMAVGEPGVVAKTSIWTAVANIALTVALAPPFGVWGVLAGTVIALTGGAVAQVILVQKRFSLSAQSYRDAVIPALSVYTALAVPVAALSYTHLFHGRAVEAVALVCLSGAYVAACGAWAARSGRLPAAMMNRLARLQLLRTPG